MTTRMSVSDLLHITSTRQVGGITYHSMGDFNSKVLIGQYIQAIAEYFSEDVEFTVKTPAYEDAVITVRVAEDKISKKDNKNSSVTRPYVGVKKIPIGYNSSGGAVYYNLTDTQRNEWLMDTYRSVLFMVSEKGSKAPLHEANEVLGKILKLGKPNDKGEVFLEGDMEQGFDKGYLVPNLTPTNTQAFSTRPDQGWSPVIHMTVSPDGSIKIDSKKHVEKKPWYKRVVAWLFSLFKKK